MKKAFIGAILISLAFAVPAFAAKENQHQNSGSRFEERKAEILNRIDEHRACIQVAESHEDIKACRDKFGGDGRHSGSRGKGGKKKE